MPVTPAAPAARPTLAPMPVTFDQARQLADDLLRPSWRPDDGTFAVGPYGWEDGTHWHVVYGAAEAATDSNYVLMDAPALLVDKSTGAVEQLSYIDNLDRLAAMRPVGDHPPVPEGD